ncbi:prohead protease/major capsid protein fusion protein [Polaromonas sp.]|uniref:prohead protease/major capsid protein fusion protein n=1 Tax=Polaromonas sp. TaxID=1869339 RepID=UPI003BB69BD3
MPQLQTRTADMPLASLQMAVRNFTRAAEPAVAAEASAAPAARFELVFSTGAPVRRYDWQNSRYYMEKLAVTPEAVNLDRLERGAPLLNSHLAWDLEDQIGVCDQPVIANGIGTVQSQLSRRESVRGIVQDLEDRVIRNVSVGYVREAIEMVAPSEEAGMWVYRVTRWTPMEVSLVAIPADMDSQVRSEGGRLTDNEGRELRTYPCVITGATTPEQRAAAPAAVPPIPTAGNPAATQTRNPESTTMPQAQAPAAGNSTAAEPTTRAAPAAAPEAANADRTAGMQAERTRQADIRTAVQAARSTLGADADALSTRLIDAGVSIDEARREVLEALTQRSNATASRGAAGIRTISDEVDVNRTRMADAIALRAQPGRTQMGEHVIDVVGARAFRGMDLIDLARRSISMAGGNPDGLTRREIAMAALNLDADARRAAGMHSTSDFTNVLANTVSRSLRAAYQQAPRTFTGWARRSSNKDFREKAVTQLSELGKFEKTKEGGEYKYLSFGDSAEKYSLSKYGGIIAITWEALVNDDMSAFDRLPLMIAEEAAATEGDIVYGILSANAAMSDGVALFHADHSNLAGAGAAINLTTLGAARAAMRKQTGPQGRVLNLEPSFLVVGPDKEMEAYQYTSAQFVAAKNVDINPASNTQLEVVIDNRIAGNAWFLAANPGRVDTVEYSYLEGEEGLFTERKEGFEVDGLLIKARHVFAAKAIDSRGLYKNAGN